MSRAFDLTYSIISHFFCFKLQNFDLSYVDGRQTLTHLDLSQGTLEILILDNSNHISM